MAVQTLKTRETDPESQQANSTADPVDSQNGGLFEREDWTLFRTLATLGQKAGVSIEQLPSVVAKELVDNGLDVAGICKVEMLKGENGFWVVNPGDGIPGDDEAIARLFSIRRPLASSKLLRRPSRGALGNGLRVVAGAVLASGGTLDVRTRGRSLRLTPQADNGETLAVRIADRPGFDPKSGTRIDVRFGPSLQCTEASLEWAQWATLLANGGDGYSGKTSPHWYDGDSFFELLRAAGQRTVRDMVAEFDGCAEPKAGRIANGHRGRLATSLDRGEADRLHAILKANARLVHPRRLGAVGPLDGILGEHAKLEGSLPIRGTGGPEVRLPMVIEAWALIAEEPSVAVSVNRTLITAPLKAWHSKSELHLSGCGLGHRFDVGRRPVWLSINIETPYMPITSDGKAPNLLPILGPIADVVQKAIGRAKRKTPATGKAGAKITQKDAILGCLDQAIAKASGGVHRYNQRNLYYASRELVKSLYGVEEPTFSYFCTVITDHENTLGHDLPGITRDNRGTLYHPHTGQEISLGTLSVEAYERPAWTFNKILYCEKEGFFPILRDVRWPERHDCALMTSKGFASRAARDVIDLLGETDEDLWFFCIHDGDAAGTMIYQSLQEGTKARPARTVHIMNLGLEPDEALEMGLPAEPVERKSDKAAPVADYVADEWREWLQTKRVELNAMTTPQFLAWLDAKMVPFAGKVIPPETALRTRLEQDVRGELEERITSQILREARATERIETALEARRPAIADRLVTLSAEISEHHRRYPADPWTEPVARVAQAIVGATDEKGSDS